MNESMRVCKRSSPFENGRRPYRRSSACVRAGMRNEGINRDNSRLRPFEMTAIRTRVPRLCPLRTPFATMSFLHSRERHKLVSNVTKSFTCVCTHPLPIYTHFEKGDWASTDQRSCSFSVCRRGTRVEREIAVARLQEECKHVNFCPVGAEAPFAWWKSIITGARGLVVFQGMAVELSAEARWNRRTPVDFRISATKEPRTLFSDRDDPDSLLVHFRREKARNDKGRSFEARPEGEGGFRANDIRLRPRKKD